MADKTFHNAGVGSVGLAGGAMCAPGEEIELSEKDLARPGVKKFIEDEVLVAGKAPKAKTDEPKADEKAKG